MHIADEVDMYAVKTDKHSGSNELTCECIDMKQGPVVRAEFSDLIRKLENAKE